MHRLNSGGKPDRQCQARDQSVILPMPDLLIALINKIATKEGYLRSAEPNFAPALEVAEDAASVEVEHVPPAPQMMPIDGRADAVQPALGADDTMAGEMVPGHEADEGRPILDHLCTVHGRAPASASPA